MQQRLAWVVPSYSISSTPRHDVDRACTLLTLTRDDFEQIQVLRDRFLEMVAQYPNTRLMEVEFNRDDMLRLNGPSRHNLFSLPSVAYQLEAHLLEAFDKMIPERSGSNKSKKAEDEMDVIVFSLWSGLDQFRLGFERRFKSDYITANKRFVLEPLLLSSIEKAFTEPDNIVGKLPGVKPSLLVGKKSSDVVFSRHICTADDCCSR